MHRSLLHSAQHSSSADWASGTGSAVPARAEWGSVVDMFPAALDLFSTWTLTKQGLELVSNAANTKRFDSVLGETQSCLSAAHVPVLLKQTREEPRLCPPTELTRAERRWLGQVALELYFSQLLGSDWAAVDLWPSRLGIDTEGDAVWYPRPLYLRWDPQFARALRDLYSGFFLDEPERFERGSRELGLGKARDLLLRHMGEGHQRGVRFSPAELQATLQALARLRCGQGSLHGNFMAFGIYLSSLHAFLESLDLQFDVRSAFRRSHVATQAAEGTSS